MTGEDVVCPACGMQNDPGMAERYGVCTHCGADLRQMDAGPVQESAQQTAYGYHQPPGAQAPPPGAQPYPPPPGYGMPWPPTFHPGVYERPGQPSRLDGRNLFRLLFRPKQAFEDLYDHTDSKQGWTLALVFIIISSMVNATFFYLMFPTMEMPAEIADLLPARWTAFVSGFVQMLIWLLIFYVTAYLVYTFLKSPTNSRRPSLKMTIGLMGYAKFPAFIVGFFLTAITPFYTAASLEYQEAARDLDPGEVPEFGDFCGLAILYFVIIIIMFVWAIWVHSHANSVANDTRLGTSFAFTLIAWIVTGLVYIGVSFALAIVIGIGLV